MVKKLNNTQQNQYINFLTEHKILMGLNEYAIHLCVDIMESDDFAYVNVDIYEKTLMIQVSEDFMKATDERKMNILLHELIHGRMAIYRKEMFEHTSIMEEHLVNDLTRGFERHSKLEFGETDDKVNA